MSKATFRQLLQELEEIVKHDAVERRWSAQQLRMQLDAVQKIRSILHRNGLLDQETRKSAL